VNSTPSSRPRSIILTGSTSPSFNLAAEEYLFSQREDNFLLLYVNAPCVVIGSNQAALNEVDPDFCAGHSIPILRRLSGGGAVYHDTGNLNYSFIGGKTGDPLGGRFLDPVTEALHALGVPVAAGVRKDLWLEGCKVSGTASHLSRGREMHHGTLLYDVDLRMLSGALNPGRRRDATGRATPSTPSPVRNIRPYLEARGYAPEAGRFFRRLARQLGLPEGVNSAVTFGDEERAGTVALQREKYARRSWNYRM
jgi:lipoate-protein ligase A